MAWTALFHRGQGLRSTVRSYEHEELEGTEVGTLFSNDTLDGELLATTRPHHAGKLGGRERTASAPWSGAAFETRSGKEALSPARRPGGRCRRSPTRKRRGRT